MRMNDTVARRVMLAALGTTLTSACGQGSAPIEYSTRHVITAEDSPALVGGGVAGAGDECVPGETSVRPGSWT